MSDLAAATVASVRLKGLQSLRGLAALLVLWAHSIHIPAARTSAVFSDVGAIGVDCFFVLSGYVLAASSQRWGRNWRAFLLARAKRIVPFYWLMSVPAVLVHMAAQGDLITIIASATFVLIGDGRALVATLIPPGWSLSFEAWFYVLLALMMAVPPKILRCSPAQAVAKFFCGWALFWSVVVLSSADFGYGYSVLLYLTHPICLEFAAGIGLWLVRGRLVGLRRPRRVGALVALGLVGSLWGVFQSKQLAYHSEMITSVFLGGERALIWGAAAALLASLALLADFHRWVTWPGFTLFLGDASFAIYLSHWYLIDIMKPLPSGIFPAPVVSGGFILASLALGSAVHVGIERKVLARLGVK